MKVDHFPKETFSSPHTHKYVYIYDNICICNDMHIYIMIYIYIYTDNDMYTDKVFYMKNIDMYISIYNIFFYK